MKEEAKHYHEASGTMQQVVWGGGWGTGQLHLVEDVLAYRRGGWAR